MRRKKIGFQIDDSTRIKGPFVATIGFFDGVHRGHQYLIKEVIEAAKTYGLKSMVVTFDNHPREVLDPHFHPQLLSSEKEKLWQIGSTGVDRCGMLHFTPVMARMSAREFMQRVLLEQLDVRMLVIGYDNRFGHDRTETFEDYERYGKEMGITVMRAAPFTLDSGVTVSSSAIRKLLLAGDVETARQCQGQYYMMTGHVVEGRQTGRKLGFPTANIQLDSEYKLVPKPGVYSVKVQVEGSRKIRHGVMNIGSCPTFDGESLTLEVHIINYHRSIYHKLVTVFLCRRLRSERKFDDVALLVEQMSEDVRMTEELLENNP